MNRVELSIFQGILLSVAAFGAMAAMIFAEIGYIQARATNDHMKKECVVLTQNAKKCNAIFRSKG